MNELTRREAIGLTVMATAACTCCALGAEDSKEFSSDDKKARKNDATETVFDRKAVGLSSVGIL
ncbi:MAG: hypothetical protein KatS3mg104_2032 [Phycisphaerae bacterium]|nr:MAG: hypothetical protein KatS3mg104_2032 [Phycisphaerae bacterium]